MPDEKELFTIPIDAVVVVRDGQHRMDAFVPSMPTSSEAVSTHRQILAYPAVWEIEALGKYAETKRDELVASLRTGAYGDLLRSLAILKIPICEPRSLASTLVSRIQEGRRALEVCGRAADHIGMFRREHPHHNTNHDLVMASELLRRLDRES